MLTQTPPPMPPASTNPRALWLAATLAVSMTAGACRSKGQPPDRHDLTKAITTYLQKRGDLCIARADWPVDVTPDDFAAQTRDGVQMPVLESLKLVESSILPGGVIRYQLTTLGKQHYIDRDTRQPVSPDSPRHKASDFCVARLTLDQITHVELHEAPDQPSHAVVTYTYDVEAPAWTRDPSARRVFPAVARLLSGARSATLQEELTLAPEGWVANELLPDVLAKGAVDRGAVAATTASRP